ncbi:MAG: hypothetical protein RSH78_00030 [Bacilli bacterium]|uniref:hypothetical protein n=1 Tax=Clostridium sp. TaxID=1506 RepID=UPI002FC7842A
MCECKGIVLVSSSFSDDYVCLYYKCEKCNTSIHKMFKLTSATHFKDGEIVERKDNKNIK